MSTVVVTGASRGIGLAFVELLLGCGHRVVAAIRSTSPSEPLRGLISAAGSSGSVVTMDLADDDSIRRATAEVASQVEGIDALFHVAGINRIAGLPREATSGPVSQIDVAAVLEMVRVNALAPLQVTRELRAQLVAGTPGKVVCVSSDRGSLSMADAFGSIGYSVSKAALNMVVRKLARELAPRRVSVAALHPGWVQTDMGGEGAELTPRQSAEDLFALMETLDMAETGMFLDRRKETMPW